MVAPDEKPLKFCKSIKYLDRVIAGTLEGRLLILFMSSI